MKLTREEYLGKRDALAEPKSPAEWDRIGQSLANEVMREKRDAARLEAKTQPKVAS